MKQKITAKYTLLLILALIIVSYTIFQAHKIIIGPQVTIHTPTNGATVANTLLMVTGTAERVSLLTMNGRSIFIDTNGAFAEKLLLSPGYNTITIEAQDKFGKKITKSLQVVLNE